MEQTRWNKRLHQKSLYGLKQASRNWNEKFTIFLQSYELQASAPDPCVFTSIQDGRKIILGIFIDDGIIAATHNKDIDKLLHFLITEFKIQIMNAESFIGIEIDKRQDGLIHLSQKVYTRKILSKFNMTVAKSVTTPAENVNLDEGVLVKNYPLREAVGSLIYLSIGTRPDISFAVGNISRYLNKPTETGVTAVKRIFKYLQGTLDYGIPYKVNSKYSLNCYSDSDYAGDITTRKSTSGFVFMMGTGPISWCSQLQR